MKKFIYSLFMFTAFLFSSAFLSEEASAASDDLSFHIMNTYLHDTDPDEGEIGGTFTVYVSGDDTVELEGYTIEFGDSTIIGEIEATGKKLYTFEIPENTAIPEDQRDIHLRYVYKSGMETDWIGMTLTILDNVSAEQNVEKVDMDLGNINVSYSEWEAGRNSDDLAPWISVNSSNHDLKVVLYFLDKDGEVLSQIGQMDMNTSTRFPVLNEETMPEGAAAIGVFAKKDNQESVDYIGLGLLNYPSSNIQDAYLFDTDPSTGKVSGTLTWTAPKVEENFRTYSIYITWYGNPVKKLGEVLPNGSDEYSFDIPSGTTVSSGERIEIFQEFKGLNYGNGDIVTFIDKNPETMKPRSLKLEDMEVSYDDQLLSITTEALQAGDSLIVYDQSTNGKILYDSDPVMGGYLSTGLHQKGLSKIYVAVKNLFGIEGERTEILLGDQDTPTGWIPESDGWYYYSPETNEPVKGWESVEGIWYYFNDNGLMQTGWVKDGGTWYFMNNSGAMAKGWVKDGGTWYFMNNSGAMAKGWVKDGGAWYFMNNSGAMAKGWVKDGGTWYFMNNSGAMAKGWVKDGSAWYFMNNSGAMAKGWVKDGGTWYFMNNSGAMAKGWVKDGSAWYFMNNSGAMVNDWKQINGKWYYFYSGGQMAYNTTIGGYRLGDDGAMR